MEKFENHIVICGWNNSAEQFMKELEKHPKKVKRVTVALTLKPSSEIDAKNVIIKQGDFTKEEKLNGVNIKGASHVLIVSEQIRGISAESEDARSFLACSLIRNQLPSIPITVQLLKMENATVLQKAVKGVEVIVSDEITGGLLLKSIGSPGTSRLFSTLISHTEDNIRKIPVSNLNKSFNAFHELITFCREPSRSWLPIALEKDGKFFINPMDDFEITGGEYLFFIQSEMDV